MGLSLKHQHGLRPAVQDRLIFRPGKKRQPRGKRRRPNGADPSRTTAATWLRSCPVIRPLTRLPSGRADRRIQGSLTAARNCAFAWADSGGSDLRLAANIRSGDGDSALLRWLRGASRRSERRTLPRSTSRSTLARAHAARPRRSWRRLSRALVRNVSVVCGMRALAARSLTASVTLAGTDATARSCNVLWGRIGPRTGARRSRLR
jgi:hypothetical protein